MPVAAIIEFLIQAEPAVQELVLSIIKMIQDNKAGLLTAEQATNDATAALSQLLGRQADPAAQDAIDLAAVTREAHEKFDTSDKPKP